MKRRNPDIPIDLEYEWNQLSIREQTLVNDLKVEEENIVSDIQKLHINDLIFLLCGSRFVNTSWIGRLFEETFGVSIPAATGKSAMKWFHQCSYNSVIQGRRAKWRFNNVEEIANRVLNNPTPELVDGLQPYIVQRFQNNYSLLKPEIQLLFERAEMLRKHRQELPQQAQIYLQYKTLKNLPIKSAKEERLDKEREKNKKRDAKLKKVPHALTDEAREMILFIWQQNHLLTAFNIRDQVNAQPHLNVNLAMVNEVLFAP